MDSLERSIGPPTFMVVVSDYATFEGTPIIDAEGWLRRMLKAGFDGCRRGCAASPMKPEIVGDVAEFIAPGADRRYR
ncbi:hypothetical protein ACIGKR_31970 [Rhodococcus qingshengii]|uniref:hypothetical protein n=1 Tax=Rhodococcus qingshengii TaxID=334542 RepID=UPI0037C98995